MTLKIAMLSLLLLSSAAATQTSGFLCPNLHPVPENYQATGNADLDRAVAICEKHRIVSALVYSEGGAPRAFEPAWEACFKIMSMWDKSDRARQIKEQAEQEQRDKLFVEEEAKKSSP